MRHGVVVMLAIAAVGCSSTSVPVNVQVSEEPETEVKIKSESAMNTIYGIWIGKGPRILSESGRPLPESKAWIYCGGVPEMLEVDEDGYIIFNRYITAAECYSHHSGVFRFLDVACPGYHSKCHISFYDDNGVIAEVRMRPIVDQEPYQEFSASIVVSAGKADQSLGFDLLEGDWLPPFGWGKTEDIRVELQPGGSSAKMFNVSSRGIGKSRNVNDSAPFFTFTFVRAGDGYDRFGGCYDCCTNTLRSVGRYDNSHCAFRARGHFGSVDEFVVDKRREYYSEIVDGKPVQKEGPEAFHIYIAGKVNRVAGLKTLEPPRSIGTPRSPVFHPAPAGGGRMAFGVSDDGRTAVYFGWTDDSARVPEVFNRGVYTDDPARDLPQVETIYLDVYGRSRRSPVIRGLPKFKTLVMLPFCGALFDGRNRIEEKAFADNSNLDTVVFAVSNGDSTDVAENSFSGCATNLTAVFVEASYSGIRPWEEVAVTNVFTKMVKVGIPHTRSNSERTVPRVDIKRGTVELPGIVYTEEFLDMEYSGGRILRHRKDGSTEKLFK